MGLKRMQECDNARKAAELVSGYTPTSVRSSVYVGVERLLLLVETPLRKLLQTIIYISSFLLKRKLGIVKRIQKQIDRFALTSLEHIISNT
jgi:hypothetical protein